MKIDCEIDLDDVLKQIPAEAIADYLAFHGDVDDLLRHIGDTALVRFLLKNNSAEHILDEMCEVSDVEAQLQSWTEWLNKKKGAAS